MALEHLKNATYQLIDSYYKSDSSVKGRKFKNFFDGLCKHIFDINYTMFEGLGEFPLLYNERMSYSSIAAAINAMTPYHISEFGMDCRDYKLKNEDKKRRVVDFWCKSKEKDFDVWIEVKSLQFCVSKKAKWEIGSENSKIIQDALTQVLDIHTINKQDKVQHHKLVLLSIRTYCSTKDFDELLACGDLDSVPQILADELDREYQKVDGRTKRHLSQGVLLGVLDLREHIKKDKSKDILHTIDKLYGYSGFDKYVAPYVILAGIVIAPPKS